MATQTHGVSTRTVPFNEVPAGEGVVVTSKSWNSDGSTRLECGCGAIFIWSSDVQNHWLPSRRFLNFCPGCGEPISGCAIPIYREPALAED